MTQRSAQAQPDVSVIVCTHDRVNCLEVCVRSLLANAGLPPERYEVVVVANACTDGTAERVRAGLDGLGPVRVVEEPRVGLSNARNCGIANARADILTFLDDDVVCRPGFLPPIVEAFQDRRVLAVAGRVLPDQDAPVPEWMKRRYSGFIATNLDYGTEQAFLDDRNGPVGANMSFRRDVFGRLGGFDARLGRTGRKLLANEEFVLVERIKQVKCSCRYVPKATVVHYAHPKRVGRLYMLRRAYWKGVSDHRTVFLTRTHGGIPGVTHAIGQLFKKAARPLQALGREIYEGTFWVLMAAVCRVGYLVDAVASLSGRSSGPRRRGRFGRLLARARTWLAVRAKWLGHGALALANRRPRRLSVQLQTTSVCNGRCVMCPYPESWQRHNPGTMSDDLFDRLLEQLKDYKIGKLCLYLENEPLLDGRFFERLQKARDTLRYDVLEISTNASTLGEEKAEQLAAALEGTPAELWISFHGIGKESYERIMGLNYERSLRNVIAALRAADRHGLKVVIRAAGSALRKDKAASPLHFTPRQAREFWAQVFWDNHISPSAEVRYLAYHDRSGEIERNKEYNFGFHRRSLLGFYCDRADGWLHVLYNGDVILCCNDYHRRTIIGNLEEQSVAELLKSREYRRYRLMVMGLAPSPGDFICKKCTKPGG